MSDATLTLERVLARFQGQGRTQLLPALHAVQEALGYISPEAARAVARALGIPEADVYGVATFYALFSTEPQGRHQVHVCYGPVCRQHGADQVTEALERVWHVRVGETTEDREWTLKTAPCLGLCEHAPVAWVDGRAVALDPNASPETLAARVEAAARRETEEPTPVVGGSVRVLTAWEDPSQPRSLGAYRAAGGYQAFEHARAGQAPDEVIAAVEASGLFGRGGAAFPTGRKWRYAAQAEGRPKYVVVNADESEPGTFKDRALLEADPHAVLEGALLAAYAIQAERVYVYVRGEYGRAYRILRRALDEARAAGYIGPRSDNGPWRVEVEIRRGAGAYVCGEETALFESIEGKRGYPRVKPPYPTTHGLFGKPTVINNVETLAAVPFIVREGPEAYRRYGTSDSPGPKLFPVSGDVARPGVYEAPFGITLRELLELAGGPVGSVRAILLGGAAGSFVGPEALDVPLTLEDLRAAGLSLGSAAVMVFNAERDLEQVLLDVAEFFREESCGKCYPCQLGTQRQWELLRLMRARRAPDQARARLEDIAVAMTEASLCGLGQTAGLAIQSALRRWPELFT
ncbi:MAG: NADH-quinone oxidoreductase subunit E [Chloroflexi bacterium]|nr:NADH-quinone oxidoreductase subunit E [Chloroflexota bacterium]